MRAHTDRARRYARGAQVASGFPLPLVEVREVRERLERVRAWMAQVGQSVGQPCKLRELYELHTEAEALRLQVEPLPAAIRAPPLPPPAATRAPSRCNMCACPPTPCPLPRCCGG